MERRWGNRVVLDEPVTVKRDGDTLGTAHLCELSLSGAFLKTDWTLPQLSRLHLEMPCSSARHRSRTTSVEAFVVRHCPDGVGVEWCEFAPPEVAELMEERRRVAALPVQVKRSQPRMRR